MSFDIQQLHIPDNSPEADLIGGIVAKNHVSPGEAVLAALGALAVLQNPDKYPLAPTRAKPGELLFGLFADEPLLIKRISDEALAARKGEIVKRVSV
ncbi:MAG TPA: hypothetical protein VGL56_20895 [Fimbriimonadaceae bacterium]|jgi:hypothetical protein